MADSRTVDDKSAASVAPKVETPSAYTDPLHAAIEPELLSALHDAMMGSDPLAGRNMIQHAIANGVPASDIADHYIPTLARGYGAMWCSDEMGFADVTIATSRLQGALRELEQRWSSSKPTSGPVSTVLLLVPKDIFHTLGAFVLKGQLRRKGISVKLLLGASAKTIPEELRGASFDAIFISVSQGEELSSLRTLVDTIRGEMTQAPPIIIGGAALDTVAADAVLRKTGADFAAQELTKALDYCGRRRTKRDDHSNKYRG